MSGTSYTGEAAGLIKARVSAKYSAVAAAKQAWPGVEFDAPSDKSSWVEFAMMWGQGHRLTQANESANMIPGVLHVTVSTDTNIGQKAAYDLIDAFRQAISRFTINGTHTSVWFGVPSGPITLEQGEAWFQLAASCPFEVLESLVAAA